ncbi:MAG: HAMP domain-containing histidine kinase [Salinivirgaceae bacterium]|nr:HAMP domain-containing histidine kinase [Salinivirgaceae bacterium]
MKRIISSYKYIILFFLLITSSHFVPKLDIHIEEKEADIQSFHSILIEKESESDKWIDTILQAKIQDRLPDFLNSNYRNLNRIFIEKGIAFYIYEGGTLNYWTNNSLVVPKTTDWLNNTKNFAKLENAFVEIRKQKQGSITVVGLINIKNNYPYENEFLKNEFHPSFNLQKPHTIFLGSKKSVESIFNSSGDYLFSLKPSESSSIETSLQIALILLILSLISLTFAAQSFFKTKPLTIVKFLAFSFSVIAFRFLFQYLNFPNALYELEIFQPKYLAFSSIFPSIGELLITVITVTYLIFIFYLKLGVSELKDFSKKKNQLKIFFWFIVFSVYGVFSYYLFEHLIIDSNFQYEAYDVLNLSLLSFLGYFIIVILFIGLILLFDKACSQIKNHISFNKFLILIFAYGLILIAIALSIKKSNFLISILFFIFALTYWAFIRFKKTPKFSSFVIIIALFAAFATYFIRSKNFNKRIDESKVLAVNLAREQDPIAEIIFIDIIKDIPKDTSIQNLLTHEEFHYEKLMNYVNQNYFTGYLGRYVFQLTICNYSDSILIDLEEDDWQHCHGFFGNLIENYGIELGIPGLYYLKNNMGGINYFLKIEIPLKDDWKNATLFFELSSKPNFEVLGYPELLLEKPIGIHDNYRNTNYAKYVSNQLLTRSGDFPYALDRSVYKYYDEEFAFFQSEGYDHLLYNADEDNTILISYPTVHFYNILISFTYIFLFLLIQVSVLLIFANKLTRLIDINFSIKNKIVYSMIIILFMSLIIVGGGTIYYTFRQFENNQFNILSEKIQSVLVELEHKFANTQNIHDISPDYINSLLVKFSNVFYTDINLYDLEGNMVGTSRSEIFDRNLTSSKINSNAFCELIINKKARLVQKEKIGKLEYYSAYIPFTSSDNKLLAYLNLPYFSKEFILRQELMRVVVAFINIYAFLIIISMAVAVYISNKLTQPLRLVQQRIKNINLSKENERIEYTGDDEIADLVFEYNRMLDELATSAKLLAKSERESAWREMARQIAHEIKNPLTPMKLSVQLLQRSWSNKDEDFDDRFQRFSQNLIEQIDSLSSIATAFSQFARMPIAKLEKVNILERIEHSCELFKDIGHTKIKIIETQNKNIFVSGDKERLLQVFNNLLKNAIQASYKDKAGCITIAILHQEKNVIVEINDNGIGISKEMEDRLFEPNFTTKSSGTGLGLSIVKNIVEESGGTIWFKSSPEKGTSFFVSLPVYEESSES